MTSDAGAPIAGAQVFLEKMNLGTTTKEDGTYRFTIPAARATGQKVALNVKLIGFKPKSVLIALKGGEQTVDFVLGAQAVVLQQVVVTGEGILTTNEKLGETVNTVHTDAIVASNESNVTNALSAKAPNVQIQSQSGDPGSSTSIQIRGLKSFSGDGQPLFVVDGVPIDNTTQSTELVPSQGTVMPNRAADINPNDIESVTILKGAAASAIYGARASQGVVLITTKSGKPGTTRYNFRTTYGSNDVTQGYPLQTSYAQGSAGGNGSCNVTDCVGVKYTWGNALATGTPTYDHMADMFVTGHVWDNVLSISGGDDRRQFYFSAGYNMNDGDVVGGQNSYNRATIKLRGSQMLGDRMKVGVNVNYVNSEGHYVQRGNNVDGIMLGGLRTPPEFNNFYYLDNVSGLQRSFRFPNPSSASLQTSRGYDNPIWVATSMPAQSTLNRVYGNIDFNWNPTDWMTVQWTPGVDYYTDQRLEALPFTSSSNPIGGVTRADFMNTIVNSVITLVGNHTFNPDFSGTVTLGNEINSSNYMENWVQGFGLVSPTPYTLTNTITWNPIDDQTLVHSQSYFAQVTADLYDQLYLTAAIRNDGFSTFAQNTSRAWYPKASLAWTITKSVKAGDWLQFAKLRAAYGETGKPPTAYSTLNTFVANSFYEYGGLGWLKTVYQGQPGLTSSTTVGTDSLRPERQKESEVGLDAGLWNGIIDLGLTYYSGTASDIIILLPLPPSSGYQAEQVNAASVSNKGIEFTMNVNSPKTNKDVQWQVGVVWGQNRNKVLAIHGADEVTLGSGFFAQVARPGYSMASFEGYDWIRCGRGLSNAAGQAIDVAGQCGNAPSGAMYIDATGFPEIDYSLLRILGSPQPNWAGSLHASITLYSKWQVSALLDVRNGSQAWNGTRGALYSYGTHKDTNDRGVVAGLAFGSSGFYPGAVAGPGAGMLVPIDQNWFQGDGGSFGDCTACFTEDAGFTKLREIAVQYTWDSKTVTQSLGLSSIDFRIAGRNLYTWTKYTGIDPEMNLEGAGLTQGGDWFNNPQARSLVFSIGLNK